MNRAIGGIANDAIGTDLCSPRYLEVLRHTEVRIRGLTWEHQQTAPNLGLEIASHLPSGRTLWVASTLERRLATLSWQWAMIDQGTIVVENILQIESNLYPIDETGSSFGPARRIRTLAGILWSLDWCDCIRQYIASSPRS